MGTFESPPIRLTVIFDNWVRPIRRLTDVTMGPTDLICGPADLPEESSRRPYPIRDLEYT
jgi:hypothetical protein